jgi:hypothetical protein
MLRRLSVIALALAATAAYAQHFESEGNDSKAAANAFTVAVGEFIQGNSLGTTGVNLDYFRVKTVADALAIYQYRLTLTTAGTAGHVGTIRGLTQTAGVPNAGTDATFQTSSTVTNPPRYNQWYGFGKAEELYYRVTGTASTTADYVSTLSRTTITPVDLGSYAEGSITITTVGQGHTTDTDLWVYDGALNAIPGYGNDDHFGGSTLGSTLTRTYTAGTYYLALSNFQLANDLGSPADDDFRTGTTMDFPNVIANSSTTVGLNMAFNIGGNSFAATKSSQYEVYWGKFTVVPEPGTFVALGLGAAVLLRRRRNKKA